MNIKCNMDLDIIDNRCKQMYRLTRNNSEQFHSVQLVSRGFVRNRRFCLRGLPCVAFLNSGAYMRV